MALVCFADGITHANLCKKFITEPLASLEEAMKMTKVYIVESHHEVIKNYKVRILETWKKANQANHKEEKEKPFKTKSLFNASRSEIFIKMKGHIPMDNQKLLAEAQEQEQR